MIGPRVELAACGQKRVDLAIDGDVVVRDGALRLGQALRDDLAHLADTHILVGSLARRRGRRRGGPRPRGGPRRALAHRAGDVELDHPSAGSGPCDRAELEACLAGHAPRQRAREDAAFGARRSVGGGGGLRGAPSLCGGAAERRLDVGLHHLAARAGAGERGEVEPRLGRHAPRQRRRGVAVALRCRRLGGGRRGFGLGSGRRPGGRRLGRAGDRRAVLGQVGSGQRGLVLAFAQQQPDHRVDLHPFGALGNDDLAERSLVGGLDLHRRLVGLDLGDHVARADFVALLLVPLGEVALGHGGRKGGHQDLDRHVPCLWPGCGTVSRGSRRTWRRRPPCRARAAPASPDWRRRAAARPRRRHGPPARRASRTPSPS